MTQCNLEEINLKFSKHIWCDCCTYWVCSLSLSLNPLWHTFCIAGLKPVIHALTVSPVIVQSEVSAFCLFHMMKETVFRHTLKLLFWSDINSLTIIMLNENSSHTKTLSSSGPHK
jgi:hypothetical protein